MGWQARDTGLAAGHLPLDTVPQCGCWIYLKTQLLIGTHTGSAHQICPAVEL